MFLKCFTTIITESTSPCDVTFDKVLTFENNDESTLKMLSGDEINIETKDQPQKKTESIQKSIM